MQKTEPFVGVDLHLKTSQITTMDSQGENKEKVKLFNDKEEIIEFFDPLPRSASISIEATYNWPWLVDLLEDMGFSPKLVHPKKVRIIAESTVKTDKIDSEVLAHLDRLNFLPLSYIPSKEDRRIRELLRYRQYLVKIRTALKNRIHSSLAKLGIQHQFSDLFGTAGREFLIDLDLHPAYKKPILEQLELVSLLDEKIAGVEKIIKEQSQQNPSAQIITTAPGLGNLSALHLAIEIGPVNRFKNYKKIVSFAGLSSTVSQTGEKTHYGHINKDSNPFIRWVLIEAVPKAIKKDPKLRACYYKILIKKGQANAKIAVARKLLIAIYFMLKNREPYKLCHNFNLNKSTKQISRLNPLRMQGTN